MYKFFRNILFCFDPEKIHHFTVGLLKIGRYIPFFGSIMRACCTVNSPKLEREVCGIKFKNPVGLAAGFDKNAEVYNELSNLGFGFIEIGTVTRNAQNGNSKPRLFRVTKDKAIINRMGFNNKGVDAALENLKKKRCKDLIIGGNIGKNTDIDNADAAAEYEKTFTKLYNYVDYFVVNISCPNVANLQNLQNKDFLDKLFSQLTDFRQYRDIYKPIFVKISPDLTFEQIDEIIEIVQQHGIDGIVAVNTSNSRTDLTISAKKIQQIGNGGLSGAPLTNRALEIISHVREKTDGYLPIIGVGGIMSEDDAINMLRAGASLVQVYSGFIYNGPKFVKRINQRILLEQM